MEKNRKLWLARKYIMTAIFKNTKIVFKSFLLPKNDVKNWFFKCNFVLEKINNMSAFIIYFKKVYIFVVKTEIIYIQYPYMMFFFEFTWQNINKCPNNFIWCIKLESTHNLHKISTHPQIAFFVWNYKDEVINVFDLKSVLYVVFRW